MAAPPSGPSRARSAPATATHLGTQGIMRVPTQTQDSWVAGVVLPGPRHLRGGVPASALSVIGNADPEQRVLMNAGKVPPAFTAPIRKPANFGGRCRPAAPPRRAMRGYEGARVPPRVGRRHATGDWRGAGKLPTAARDLQWRECGSGRRGPPRCWWDPTRRSRARGRRSRGSCPSARSSM